MALPRLHCHDQFRPDVYREYELRSTPIRLGSQAPESDIPLESNFLPALTAELICQDGAWVLKARCSGIVGVGTVTLSAGEQEPLFNNSPFRLHHWICRLELPEKRASIGQGMGDVSGGLLREVDSAEVQGRGHP